MPAPAKILLCHNHYAQSGGETLVFHNLLRGLREHGHEVVTYEQENATIGSMNGRQKTAMVFAGFQSSRTRRELSLLIDTEQPDVAIVQNVFPLLSPSVYTTLSEASVPIVQATYNYRLVCPAAELYSRGNICERCLRGNYLHCAVRACYRDSVAQSAWYASIIGWHRWRGTFSKTVEVFQVPDRFMADKLSEGGLPRHLMMPNVNPFFVGDYVPATTHRGYVAFVGRLVRHKGVLTLARAISSAKHLRAVVVGAGELECELRELADTDELRGRLTLTGPLWGAPLREVLAGASAVAVPSEWYDNLPLALCEANALGTPVIASRINGIPEYVDENVNGFLFTPRDSDALAAAATRVLGLSRDDYAALARRTRQFAEERLDFAAHYRVLGPVLRTLAEKRANSRHS